MTARTDIADRLRATVAKELKQDVTAITEKHTLRDDLGLNSLDAIELMFKIEEEFDLSIPDEDMQRLATVGDVITYLDGRLNRSAPSTARSATAAGRSAAPPSKAAPRISKSRKGKGSRGHA
jgi:acyl carrier protein